MSFSDRNCWGCLASNSVSKRVTDNSVNRTCNRCGKNYTLPLLKLKKQLIYLDQNFFSESFKNKTFAFVARANRLSDLAQKQLIICPYSFSHDKESHLWFGKEKQLWDFIRTISRYKGFKLREQIETQQLINGYEYFCKNASAIHPLLLRDAISLDVHDWDRSLDVCIDWSITNFQTPSMLLEDKKRFVDEILNVLPYWRESTTTLEHDYNLEIKTHADLLIQNYVDVMSSKDIDAMLENEPFKKVSLLLDLEVGGKDFKTKYRNVVAFLRSEYFSKIPYINISSGLWAILKQEIKMKQFLQTENEGKIKSIMGGIPMDFEHLSIYAPYCDAIFTEKTMARFLMKWNTNQLSSQKLKVFSSCNWTEFDEYLDGIEKSMTSEMKEEWKIAYA